MRYYQYILLFFLGSSPLFLNAQQTQSNIPLGDGVEFTRPEGYVDSQFRELAAEYIQPQTPGDLDELLYKDGKVTPEILQRLVDMVSVKVSQQIREDLLNLKSHSRPIYKSETTNTPPTINNIDYSLDINPKASLLKRKKIYIDTNAQASPNNKNTEQLAKINSISIKGTKGSKLNINNTSQKSVVLGITLPSVVKKAKINLIMRNIKTNQDIVVSSKMIAPSKKGTTKTNIKWNSSKIPMGNYKMMVESEFYGSNGQVINKDKTYWGNNSNSEFMVMKN